MASTPKIKTIAISIKKGGRGNVMLAMFCSYWILPKFFRWKSPISNKIIIKKYSLNAKIIKI